jgi:hypothetical protein
MAQKREWRRPVGSDRLSSSSLWEHQLGREGAIQRPWLAGMIAAQTLVPVQWRALGTRLGTDRTDAL